MTHKMTNTAGLIRLIEAAQAAGYNRTLPQVDVERLDPEGFHIITDMMIHSHAAGEPVDPHYRCSVMAKVTDQDEPFEGYLDVSFENFDILTDAKEARDRLLGSKN